MKKKHLLIALIILFTLLLAAGCKASPTSAPPAGTPEASLIPTATPGSSPVHTALPQTASPPTAPLTIPSPTALPPDIAKLTGVWQRYDDVIALRKDTPFSFGDMVVIEGAFVLDGGVSIPIRVTYAPYQWEGKTFIHERRTVNQTTENVYYLGECCYHEATMTYSWLNALAGYHIPDLDFSGYFDTDSMTVINCEKTEKVFSFLLGGDSFATGLAYLFPLATDYSYPFFKPIYDYSVVLDASGALMAQTITQRGMMSRKESAEERPFTVTLTCTVRSGAPPVSAPDWSAFTRPRVPTQE